MRGALIYRLELGNELSEESTNKTEGTIKDKNRDIRFAVLPSAAYVFTAGVEIVYFHLNTLRYTPQSVGLLWTRDRSVAETST
jgi:hypothetical protein